MKSLLAHAALIPLLSSALSAALAVNVDFSRDHTGPLGGNAPVLYTSTGPAPDTGTVWNDYKVALTGAGDTIPTGYTMSNLTASDGSATSVDVTLTSGFYRSFNGAVAAASDHQDALQNQRIFANNSGTGTITISGLNSGSTYALYFIGSGFNTTYSIGAQSVSALGTVNSNDTFLLWTAGTHYASLSGVSPNPAGQIVVGVTGNGQVNGAIAGMQIVREFPVNAPPLWDSNPIVETNAMENTVYSATLADHASDPDGDALTFAKVSGPAWLSVAANGSLTGTPATGNVGANSFTVSVSDGIAPAVTATLNIAIQAFSFVDPATPVGTLPVSGGSNWVLEFSDEFNGTALNTNKWAVDVSTKSRSSRLERGIANWWWKQENVSLDGNGNLVLTTSKHGSNTMHCGSVSSDGLYEPRYGYLEARIEIADSTKDTHTAFWLQGSNMGNVDGTGNDGAEVDIFESAWFGDYTKSVVHIDGYGVNHRASTKEYTAPGLHDGYHVFGLEWTHNNMKIYYDGVLKVTYTGIWVPQVAEWLWLSTGASFGDIGNFATSPSGFLTSAKVDYVRVWQYDGNRAPYFVSNSFSKGNATEGSAYSATMAATALDDDEGDTITYSKVSGPAWLIVAPDGTLSGTPATSDAGTNTWVIMATDSQNATATTTLAIVVNALIGPNKLVGGNVRNGNFNANPGTAVTFESTSFWHNTKAGQNQVATRSNGAFDGTQNAILASIRGFGVNTEHVIAEGDTFDYSYVWKDDGNWDGATGQVTVSLFVTSDNTITGTRTNLVVDPSGLRQVNNAYESVSRDGFYTATAAVAGKTLFATIETTSTGFARLDNFFLSVTAANNAPVVDAGLDAVVFLTGASWSPLELAPGLWLDAADTSSLTLNGTAVSQWGDKSGNNRHATQGNSTNQPLRTPTGLNGMSVVTFDGSNDFFSVDLDFLAGTSHTAFIVTKATQFSNIYGTANGAQGSNSLHIGFNGANYRMNFWSNGFGPARSANFVAGSANIVNYAWNQGVGKQIFANGKSEGSNTNAGNIGTMSGGGRIGHTTTGSHTAFGGDIAEIIIIPSNISVADREKIEGYLAHKWGLAGNLAAAHPYKTVSPSGATAVATLAGSATDPENDPLTTLWSVLQGPGSVLIADPSNPATTATFSQEGTYILRLTASDGLNTAFDDVTITVISANSAPTWVADPVIKADATEDAAYAATLANDASDADAGDTLTFAKVSGPAWLTIAPGGALSGTPLTADIGTNSFIVSASDGIAAPVQATLVIEVVQALATVPDVVGLAQTTAELAITAAYLAVGIITEEHSDSVPAGDVISQALTAGASVPKGSEVDLVVSLGIDNSPKLLRTTVSAVSSTAWTTVDLGRTYQSPVIIATPIYPTSTLPPVVTRITNVTGTSFEIRIDRADGLTDPVNIDVSLVVVDEGVYTQAEHGVTMEAVKFLSTITARKGSWVAEARAFQNTYTSPVVLGQVMSANDPRWSAFWSMGSSATNPVSATSLNVGKHAGEDPITARADETLGYIVIESGSGSIDGIAYVAALGAKTVRGFGNSTSPYTYSVGGGLNSASAAAASMSGMSGNDGAWAVLSGAPAFTNTTIGLHACEDQMSDSEQEHAAERVGYIVFE